MSMANYKEQNVGSIWAQAKEPQKLKIAKFNHKNIKQDGTKNPFSSVLPDEHSSVTAGPFF